MKNASNDTLYDIVTVDIDYNNDVSIKCSKEIMEIILKRIKPLVKKIVLCYTAKGMHIYIHMKKPIGFWDAIRIRTELCDDPERIRADINRYYKGAYRFINTLFNNKSEYIVNDRGVMKLMHKSKELCFEI